MTTHDNYVIQTYSNYRYRGFAAAGPKLWSSLPADLRQADNFQQFKWLLKTYCSGVEIAEHCD